MQNHTLKLDLDADRHLIVGDLHGRYDELMRLLDLANYDQSKDIIYSVGDVIDRGKDSWKIVEFFEGERCYAVKGNHELMCLDQDWWDVWLSNGGLQCKESLRKAGVTIEQLQNIINKWPWMIEVGEPHEEHSFRIVHAEYPPMWSDTYLLSVLDNAIDHDDPSFAKLVWSRRLIDNALLNVSNLKPLLAGISFHPDRHFRTFVGHTPHKKVLKIGDHYFLDTWAGSIQSMIDAVTLEVFSTPITG